MNVQLYSYGSQRINLTLSVLFSAQRKRMLPFKVEKLELYLYVLLA
jgi:hypothetical protein